MYVSHSFKRESQLLRACYWLAQHGFDSRRMEIHPGRMPRVALQVDSVGEFVQARMIFDAIETADDEGPLPASWDLAQFQRRSTKAPADLTATASGAIGWHPHDLDPPIDAQLRDAWDA